MTYRVTTEVRQCSSGDGTVYLLTDSAGGSRAEVWPALGFNCFRWQVPQPGKDLDLLYSDPQLFAGASPTRSGIPVLFPFPNRIRDGRFRWEGKEYQLPLNDSTRKNAIHGFPCRKPWRVIGQGADAASAWVTGEFVGSRDAPEARDLWPADYCLRITVRLAGRALRLEAQVSNPDRVALPFGLGYHPYFHIPPAPGGGEADCWAETCARELWVLQDSLPTGERLAVDAARDLTQGKRVSELTMDALFTDLGSPPGTVDSLLWRAGVRQMPANVEVQLRTSPTFRELVVFNPVHRQAIALEPYTCATDAINLQQRGIDAGLRVLEPGEEWSGVIEFACLGG